MRVWFAAALLVLVAPSSSVLAKGPTTRITITGGTLTSPIEITDPAITGQFQVWTGAGTTTCIQRVCREHMTGFIIDWNSGPVEDRPVGLSRYLVSFHTTDNRVAGPPPPEQLTYVVWYEMEPESGTGFVYLPGRGDEWHLLNVRHILRGQGREGNWFRATSAWDAVFGRLIAP
jgi:hypothetical protein